MKKKILVVDDFASVRKFVCEMLEKRGFDVTGAGSAMEALSILKESGGVMDLVLTDYNMPGLTGLELLMKIKLDETMKRIPVVFLTTEQNPETMRVARDLGLSAWIKKPYRAETFFHLIETAIASNNEIKK